MGFLQIQLHQSKQHLTELATHDENLFHVKEEDRAEAKAAVKFWQHSWTHGRDESGNEANIISKDVLQNAIKN